MRKDYNTQKYTYDERKTACESAYEIGKLLSACIFMRTQNLSLLFIIIYYGMEILKRHFDNDDDLYANFEQDKFPEIIK